MAKFDISTINGDTAKRDFIKDRITQIILTSMQNEIGTEETRFIPYDLTICPDNDTEVEMKRNRVVSEVADTTDKDGFEVGVLVEINVTVKKWNPTYSKKDNVTHSPVTLADVDEALESAKEREEANAEKKRKAEENKAKRIAADKERRAKRAEKLKKNGE